jgi:hypothetical protein
MLCVSALRHRWQSLLHHLLPQHTWVRNLENPILKSGWRMQLIGYHWLAMSECPIPASDDAI